MGKMWSWLLIFAVAFFFTAGTAWAQGGGKGERKHASPEEQFKKWDANGDQKVTLEEMKAGVPADKVERVEKMFKAIAGDKDSFTLDDFKAFREKMHNKGGKKAEKAPQ